MRIGVVLNILDEEYQISVYKGIEQRAQELGIELICFQNCGTFKDILAGRNRYEAPALKLSERFVHAAEKLIFGRVVISREQLFHLFRKALISLVFAQK